MANSLPTVPIPTKIDPCPIMDAVVEIQFESPVDSAAVYGLLYPEFAKEYSKRVRLPILELPEIVRNQNPAFKFQPHHQLSNGRFNIHTGPNNFGVSVEGEYCGWQRFRPEILRAFEILRRSGVVGEIKRFGLRYINFFDFDIFQETTIGLCLGDKRLDMESTSFKTEFQSGKFVADVQFSNFAHVLKTQKNGSIFDIDVYDEDPKSDLFDRIEGEIDAAHEFEKQIFYALLKQEFIAKLKPEYPR